MEENKHILLHATSRNSHGPSGLLFIGIGRTVGKQVDHGLSSAWRSVHQCFKTHFETKPDTKIWRVVSIGIYFQDMDILMGQCWFKTVEFWGWTFSHNPIYIYLHVWGPRSASPVSSPLQVPHLFLSHLLVDLEGHRVVGAHFRGHQMGDVPLVDGDFKRHHLASDLPFNKVQEYTEDHCRPIHLAWLHDTFCWGFWSTQPGHSKKAPLPINQL